MLRVMFMTLALASAEPNMTWTDVPDSPTLTDLKVDDCTVRMDKKNLRDLAKIVEVVEKECWDKNSVMVELH